MTASLLLDAEAKLTSGQDGSCRTQLITRLEKYRDEHAFSRQGFLPPDEYEVAEGMKGALEAALTVIRNYEVGGVNPRDVSKLACFSANFSDFVNPDSLRIWRCRGCFSVLNWCLFGWMITQ